MSGPVTVLPPPFLVRSGGQICSVRRLGQGPRLVLLHGGPGLDHHVLLPLAVPLSRSFEVWLPDLPGHGASPPIDRRPSLWQLYDKTARWLRNLPGGVEYLGGHSLGAWLARELVRRGAVSPKATVLLNPVARLEGGRFQSSACDLRSELLAEVSEETGEPPVEEFVAALQQAALRDPERYDQLLRDLLPLLRKPPPHSRPAGPTLVLGCALDRLTPPSQATTIAAATQGAELRILRDCGHYPFASDPAGTAAEIERFIRSRM